VKSLFVPKIVTDDSIAFVKSFGEAIPFSKPFRRLGDAESPSQTATRRPNFASFQILQFEIFETSNLEAPNVGGGLELPSWKIDKGSGRRTSFHAYQNPKGNLRKLCSGDFHPQPKFPADSEQGEPTSPTPEAAAECKTMRVTSIPKMQMPRYTEG
jgi:hypothetical protein